MKGNRPNLVCKNLNATESVTNRVKKLELTIEMGDTDALVRCIEGCSGSRLRRETGAAVSFRVSDSLCHKRGRELVSGEPAGPTIFSPEPSELLSSPNETFQAGGERYPAASGVAGTSSSGQGTSEFQEGAAASGDAEPFMKVISQSMKKLTSTINF